MSSSLRATTDKPAGADPARLPSEGQVEELARPPPPAEELARPHRWLRRSLCDPLQSPTGGAPGLETSLARLLDQLRPTAPPPLVEEVALRPSRNPVTWSS